MSDETIFPSKEKTSERMVKDFVQNLLVNLMFVGTFSVKKYVPALGQYRYLVHVDRTQNDPNMYDDLVRCFKDVTNRFKKSKHSETLWIGLQETSNGWIIWSDLDMKFGNHLCKIRELQYLESEMHVKLIVTVTGSVEQTYSVSNLSENISTSSHTPNVKTDVTYINAKLKCMKASLSKALTITIGYILKQLRNIQHFISKSAYLIKEYSLPKWLIVYRILCTLFSILCIILHWLHLLLHFIRSCCRESNSNRKRKYTKNIDCLICDLTNLSVKVVKYAKLLNIQLSKKNEMFRCFCNDEHLDEGNFIKHLTFKHGMEKDVLLQKNNNENNIKPETFRCYCGSYKYLNRHSFMKHLAFKHGVKFNLPSKKDGDQVQKETEPFRCFCNSYTYQNESNFRKHLVFKHGIRDDLASKKDDTQPNKDSMQFRCLCSIYKYPNKHSFINHLVNKHNMKPDVDVSSINNINNTENTLGKAEKFKCSCCNYMSMNKASFIQHSVSKHSKKNENGYIKNQNNDNSQNVKRTLNNKYSNNVNRSLPFLKCYFCQFRCVTRKSFEQHLVDGHKDLNFIKILQNPVNGVLKCVYCEYKTSDKHMYEQHLQYSHKDTVHIVTSVSCSAA